MNELTGENFESLPLLGAFRITQTVHHDSRGFLFENFNSKVLRFFDTTFVQHNISESSRGVVRGMHWQSHPYPQGKYVSCVMGSIYDVIVDIRLKSPTFGQNYGTILEAGSGQSLWIPPGFAHGFQAQENSTVVSYLATAPYSLENSKGFNPLDSRVAISWPLRPIFLSENDLKLPAFAEVDSFGF